MEPVVTPPDHLKAQVDLRVRRNVDHDGSPRFIARKRCITIAIGAHSSMVNVSARRRPSIPIAANAASTNSALVPSPPASELRSCLRGALNPARATPEKVRLLVTGNPWLRQHV